MLERVTVRVVAFALQKNNAAASKVVPAEAAEEPKQKMARHDMRQAELGTSRSGDGGHLATGSARVAGLRSIYKIPASGDGSWEATTSKGPPLPVGREAAGPLQERGH